MSDEGWMSDHAREIEGEYIPPPIKSIRREPYDLFLRRKAVYVDPSLHEEPDYIDARPTNKTFQGVCYLLSFGAFCLGFNFTWWWYVLAAFLLLTGLLGLTGGH
jgi:hypothetical protein